MRWDHWLMQADVGAGGRDVVEPSAWLLAYWMGRYHGFIAAPTVSDPELLQVEQTDFRQQGAEPDTGPARPVGFQNSQGTWPYGRWIRMASISEVDGFKRWSSPPENPSTHARLPPASSRTQRWARSATGMR